MNKNKKEFMFDMEVFSSNILEARRGTYFFWGADKIEAINETMKIDYGNKTYIFSNHYWD